jgi:hypothetical protein
MSSSETQGRERRRDRRYPYELPTVVTIGKQEIVTTTRDVSFTGAFLESDTPVAERQLVKLRFTLPPEKDALELMGMLARWVPAKDGSLPGMGIQFYAMSPDQRDRWRRFIRFAASGSGVAAPTAAPAAPPPIRRAHPRHDVAFQVLLRSERDLLTLATQNVSQGGMFVSTALELPAGTQLGLSLVHPRTGEHFPLEAVVRWRGFAPVAGLGLEFVAFDADRRAELLEFIRSEIPVETVVFVPTDDPELGKALAS